MHCTIKQGAQKEHQYQMPWLMCRFIVEFHKDMEALGCLPPTLEPKATDHVADMVATIEQIIANEHGYAVDGDVFFDVASLPGYGRLSGRAQVSCFLKERKREDYAFRPLLHAHGATCNMLYNVILYCTSICMQGCQYVRKCITLKLNYVKCPPCWSKQRTKCSDHSCDVSCGVHRCMCSKHSSSHKLTQHSCHQHLVI